LVLLAAGLAIALSALAAFGSRPWDNLADRLSFFFTIALDVQVLIGVVVWVLNQAWTRDAFIGFIHPVLMLAAVAVAHVVFFVVSLVMVVLAIPTASWPL
jgi:hypothetical protein